MTMSCERRPPNARNHRRPLRVGLVTDHVGNAGGGVGEAVCNLAAALHCTNSCAVAVFARDCGRAASVFHGATVIAEHRFCVVGPSKFGYSPDLARLLLDSDLDLVHLHGLWTLSMRAVRVWSQRSGHRPYLVSPHGMLDPWAVANSAWRKRAAAWAYADACLVGAAALHALCDQEAAACRRYGLLNPIRTVPNGVWLPDPSGADAQLGFVKRRRAARTALYLGRLDPKKNLLALLQAWRHLVLAYPDLRREWRLRLVGWGPARHVLELRRFVSENALGDVVAIGDPAFGPEKAAEFGQADLFVMPSLSEGLPIAVLEAWSYRLPAVLSGYCNLDIGFREGAALPCGIAWESICETLTAALKMPRSDLEAMGDRGRALVESQFTWDAVAASFFGVYSDILAQR